MWVTTSVLSAAPWKRCFMSELYAGGAQRKQAARVGRLLSVVHQIHVTSVTVVSPRY